MSDDEDFVYAARIDFPNKPRLRAHRHVERFRDRAPAAMLIGIIRGFRAAPFALRAGGIFPWLPSPDLFRLRRPLLFRPKPLAAFAFERGSRFQPGRFLQDLIYQFVCPIFFIRDDFLNDFNG